MSPGLNLCPQFAVTECERQLLGGRVRIESLRDEPEPSGDETMPMKKCLQVLLTLLILLPTPSFARIAGGGAAKSDCYAEFQGIIANAGKGKVECMDGDRTCDADGIGIPPV